MNDPGRSDSADSTNWPAKAGGGNRLLEALSLESLSLLQPYLRQRGFGAGSILWEPNDAYDDIYFPSSGLVCIALPLPNGHDVEVASVSREGAAGMPYAAANCRTTRAIVVVGGTHTCVPAEAFCKLANQSAELAAMGALARHWILLQAQRLAACNAIHSVEARFCRWLMFATDRMGCDEIPVTQEEISALLGVRRTTVTLVAQKLQATGAINCSRGKVAIRDRQQLRAMTCNCHAAFNPGGWPSHRLHPSEIADARAS